MKTRQEIVNHVFDYFIVQKHPKSYNKDSQLCQYKCFVEEKECRCAIGCLLNPDIDVTRFECASIFEVFIKGSLNKNQKAKYLKEACEQSGINMDPSEAYFLEGLQGCHDQSTEKDFHTSFFTAFKSFVKRHELVLPS